MMKMKQIVGGALLDSLESPRMLLAARRNAPPELAGMREFPGGKVEPDESHEAALHRELTEELGVKVRLGTELQCPTSEGWPLNASAAMRVWLAELTEGTPEPLEDHDLLVWVALAGSEIMELPWIPADLPIVQALVESSRQRQFIRAGVEKALPCARLGAEDPKEVVP